MNPAQPSPQPARPANPTGLLPHQLKLGRLAAQRDVRTLEMADYLRVALLPDVPPTFGWSSKVKSWPMMLNDQLGCCTISDAGHRVQLWTTANGRPAVPTDADVLKAYRALTGYDPATGANDTGCVLLKVMNYMRRTGIGGHKLDAFVSIGLRAHKHIMLGIYLLGGVTAGLMLPISVQQQIRNGSVWSYTGGPDSTPGSWGGHDIYITDYSPAGLKCVSWGRIYEMTWEFLDAYGEEYFGPISKEWLDPKTHHAPNGLDYQGIIADANAIKA